MTDGDCIYAYGVTKRTEEPLEVTATGLEGASIGTLDCGDLSVVVSPVGTTDPERTDEAVRAHDDVLRDVIEDGRTVVPMRFGMAFEGETTLRGVVDGAADAFREALDELEGTVELGVKVVAPSGDAAAAEPDGDALDRLSEIAVETVENDLFSDRLVCNRSYLVAREDREAFDDAVDALDDAREGWVVQYTGPWPPYNFVDLRIAAGGA